MRSACSISERLVTHAIAILASIAINGVRQLSRLDATRFAMQVAEHITSQLSSGA
jgi:acetylglutamate kinase